MPRSPPTCGRCASRSASRWPVGDDLVILESMKMEIPVEAPCAGTVAEIAVQPDDQVPEGDVVAVIDEPERDSAAVTVHVERRGASASRSSPSTGPSGATRSTTQTLDELRTAIAEADGGLRVLVLTGADGHFCAGADLTGRRGRRRSPVCSSRCSTRLHDAPFPTIAAIDGAALGAGTQLAVACDLRVATPRPASASRRPSSASWSTTGPCSASPSSPARSRPGHAAGRRGVQRRRAPTASASSTGPGYLDDALDWADEIADAGAAHHRRPQAHAQPPRGGAGRRPGDQPPRSDGLGERGPPGGPRRLPRTAPEFEGHCHQIPGDERYAASPPRLWGLRSCSGAGGRSSRRRRTGRPGRPGGRSGRASMASRRWVRRRTARLMRPGDEPDEGGQAPPHRTPAALEDFVPSSSAVRCGIRLAWLPLPGHGATARQPRSCSWPLQPGTGRPRARRSPRCAGGPSTSGGTRQGEAVVALVLPGPPRLTGSTISFESTL